MSEFTPTTPTSTLDKDIRQLEADTAEVVAATHALVATIKSGYDNYWQLSDARLLAVMNADAAKTNARHNTLAQLAAACNAVLNGHNDPRFPMRAPEAAPRQDIGFEGGQFVIIPPAE